MKKPKLFIPSILGLLAIYACSKDDNNDHKSTDCVTCSIKVNSTENATYEYCQNGDDVIYTSGKIKKTYSDALVEDLVADDMFNLGAVCKQK